MLFTTYLQHIYSTFALYLQHFYSIFTAYLHLIPNLFTTYLQLIYSLSSVFVSYAAMRRYEVLSYTVFVEPRDGRRRIVQQLHGVYNTIARAWAEVANWVNVADAVRVVALWHGTPDWATACGA